VGVGVEVEDGRGVFVGDGVKVGPGNCPVPHPDVTRLIINKIKTALVRCLVFIKPPSIPYILN
jgi:hypothetical protein